MSCSPFDLRDYFLNELPADGHREVDTHIKTCGACREELERLRATQAALMALPEEEIPQRIAFVSDKIFEPSPWRRGWAALWGSTARLGFAGAAVLSVAILVSALTRPAPAPAPAPVAVTSAEIQSRIDAAVTRAVAESEARQEKRTEQIIADLDRRNTEERRRLMMAADFQMEMLQRKTNNRIVAINDFGPPGESK
jgi:anti-sigma factor RsiW